jgi:hypothetical protein
MSVYRKYSQFLLSQQEKRIGAACLVWLLAGTCSLHSLENNGRGTKAVGMANAFVAVADNLWAVNYNPAGLTQVTDIQCSAFIVPNQFGVPELRTTALAAAVPFSFATVALKAENFGFDLYKETEIGMAFALKLDQNISGGLSLNLHRLDLARYGSTQDVILHGGILANALQNVKVGFNFNNILGATVGGLDEKIPQLFTLGACWSPLEDLQVSLELEKDIRSPASMKWGIEQIVFDVLAFQGGVANNPEKYSAGIAVKYSFIEFGYAGYSHLDLGWTHQIEISFKLANE